MIFRQIRSLFSPRRYLHDRNEIYHPPGNSLGQRQWILSRSLCLYRVFVMGDIPSDERKNALKVRIRQWSPFADTGNYVIWQEETAQVWIWDESARGNAAGKANADVSRTFPETVFYPKPERDELRLISCMEGMDAQIWKHGILTASHWWPDGPFPEAWSRFLTAHDLNPAMAVPAPENIPWIAHPWGRNTGEHSFSNLPHERLWVLAAMMLFAFLLIWQSVSLWRWHEAENVLESRIAALTQEVEPLLEARNQATKYKAAAERLISLVSGPTQLALMAAVAEKLPPKSVFLAEWHYNQDNLSFVLQGANLDPRYYVETYQKLPYFKEVSAERGQAADQLTVKMKIEK